ncbi:unnamed protein product [Brassica rapa subsp. narinosa]
MVQSELNLSLYIFFFTWWCFPNEWKLHEYDGGQFVRSKSKCYKNLRLFSKPIAFKCLVLVGIALFYKALFLSSSPRNLLSIRASDSSSTYGVRTDKFLEAPQIVWGLNNQKIAFARACLTARTMNRTLLMPSLSASLFYKEVDKLLPIPFDKVFQFERFNSLCNGFVRLARFSDVRNRTQVFDLEKGSGRRWTVERDLDQLKQSVSVDEFEVINVKGKNPFLWHDHWPVKDYAKVFECMVVVDEISREADKVVTRIRQAGGDRIIMEGLVPFVAVHMRIEIDWMIHCKKLEQRQKVSEICSSKREIMERVGNISGLKTPTVLYLAVADSLLEEKEGESSVLAGWREGLIPFEKKKLGVKEEVYGKYSYLIQSAIDYESVPDPGHTTVKFAESNLQTFPPSATQGKISGGSNPPRDADDTFSGPGRSSTDEPHSGGWLHKFTVGAYKPFFDVDTSDVVDRLKESLFPFRGTFTEKTADKPDLYGPFWICTTLIFVAASIGTFVTYVAHKWKKQEWNYDINLVTWSAGVFYGYVTIIPLALYVVLKYFSAPSGLVQLFCLYGYSLFIFIPALCLSVVPVEIFRWVIAGVAGFMSATFVALNLKAHINSAGERSILIIASIFLLQLGLAVVLKLYLFTVTV